MDYQKESLDRAGEASQNELGGLGELSGHYTTDDDAISGVDLVADLGQARQFLTLLDEEAESFTFQTFTEAPGAKGNLARVFHGTLDQHAAELERLNNAGAGVFVTVNETDGKGRKGENIKRVRAVFADTDGAPLDPIMRHPMEPHFTVESSPRNYHPYWRVDDLPLGEFKAAQSSIAQRFDTDPSVNDLSRVMRLPGFWHRKGYPHQVRIIHESGALPYSADKVRAAFPPVTASKGKPKRSSHSVCESYADEVLSYVSPNGDYDPWYLILMAIHDEFGGGEIGLAIADKWSAGGSDYPGFDEIRKKWDSFTAGGGVTFAMVERMAEQAGADLDAIAKKYAQPSQAARRLAKRITERNVEALEIDHEDDEAVSKVAADPAVIDSMINGAFWSGEKGKVFLLNEEQSLNQYREPESWKFLQMRFGYPVDRDAVTEAASRLDFGKEGSKASEQARQKHINQVMKLAGEAIKDHLKYHLQRDRLEWRVDMFADQPRMEVLEDKVRIVLTHKPLDWQGDYDEAIVADFKEHFPRFDDFLTFLVASRFADDRKKSYLWILADSDWGKGFLMGVLKNLNMSVETSMKEVEAMFEGRPIGRSPEEFKRAFALVIDEFKTVKSELKQLQSEISLAPKHQLTSTVEVFAKLFFSAESVASLVTENGVEDQFANRMSIFEESGSILDRQLYREKGGAVYHDSVTAYAAEFLEGLIQEFREMGKMDAATYAETLLSDFADQYGLGTRFERFSDTLPSVGEAARDWILANRDAHNDKVIEDVGGCVYLKSARKVLDDYLEANFDRSEVGTYRKRKNEILAAMSADGRGQSTYRIHRVGNKATKCVLLKSA